MRRTGAALIAAASVLFAAAAGRDTFDTWVTTTELPLPVENTCAGAAGCEAAAIHPGALPAAGRGDNARGRGARPAVSRAPRLPGQAAIVVRARSTANERNSKPMPAINA